MEAAEPIIYEARASTVQFCKLISYIYICNVRDNKAHDARQWYVLFDIGSKSIETSCSSSSAALEGEQSKDTSQNRNLSIVLVLEKVCHCSSGDCMYCSN